MNPLHCLSLLLLGASLLWAISIAYGARRTPSRDWLKHSLTVAGWLLVLIATATFIGVFAVGPFALMVLALVVIAVATVVIYRRSERQALLWTLAYATERQIPLTHAVRAFAQERTDEIGYRAWQLALALDAGMPLDAALLASGSGVPLNVLVATRVGLACGTLPTSLRAAVFESRDIDRLLRSMIERLLFITLLLNALVGIVSFLMIKIIPTFEKMFKEFELELPPITQLLIGISQTFVVYSFVFVLAELILLPLLLFSLLHYLDWLPWGFPGVGWLRISYDRTVMLRALAQATSKQQSLEDAFAKLYDAFPTYAMRSRLSRVMLAIRSGETWTDALRRVRLITRYEQAVLVSAQAVGNLPWALETMADTAVQRLTRRLQTLIVIITYVVFVVFSGLVLLVAVATFSPLVSLISNMS